MNTQDTHSDYSKKIFADVFSTLYTKRPYLLALALILLMTAIRLVFIGTNQLDLSSDEAQYWDWSRTWQLSYYSKGPLISWLIGFWTNIYGDTQFAVRLGAVVNSIIAQLIIFIGIATLFKRASLAFLALFVANSMPLFTASSILMTTDSPLLLCWLTAFFSLYYLSIKESRLAYFALFAAMALGCLAKYMMFAFLALAIPFLILLYYFKMIDFARIKKILLVMALGAVVGLLPIFIWNAQNNWVGFLHVSSLAGVTGKKAQQFFDLPAVPEFIGGQLGIATPWWFIIALLTALAYAKEVLAKRKDRDIFVNQAQNALSKELQDIDIFRQKLILISGFLPLMTAFFLWSFHTTIYANWPAMSYVSLILLAAMGLEKLLKSMHEMSVKKRKWFNIMLITSCVLPLIIYLTPFVPIPEILDPTLRLKGWNDLSIKLEELQNSFEDPEKVFYFSSRYDTTASLSFYSPKKERSYDSNFDNRLSQYDLWPSPADKGEEFLGYDALYISKKTYYPHTYFEEKLGTLFEKIEIIPYTTKHKSGRGEDFFIIKCYNYNGTWPKQLNNSY